MTNTRIEKEKLKQNNVIKFCRISRHNINKNLKEKKFYFFISFEKENSH